MYDMMFGAAVSMYIGLPAGHLEIALRCLITAGPVLVMLGGGLWWLYVTQVKPDPLNYEDCRGLHLITANRSSRKPGELCKGELLLTIPNQEW